MVKVLSACKAAGVRTYVTADPTHEQFDPMRPLIDVWSTQPFAPDRDTVLADMKARPVEYWCYPNHVNGENDHTPVTGARMTYGFGFWRSGFRTLIPWIYQSSTAIRSTISTVSRWISSTAANLTARRSRSRCGRRIGKGYNDYRYLYTLEQRIAEAKTSTSQTVRDAAARAESGVEIVWDAIRVQTKYKHDDLWSPEDFDAYRWILAQQIIAIDEASRR